LVQINKIILKNYRNFSSFETKFHSKCNILIGKNGVGKTNILESLSLIGKGRGFRNDNISNLIKNKEENFLIQAEFEKENNLYDLKIFSKFINKKHHKISSLNDDISPSSKDFIYSNFSYLLFVPDMERLFQASPSFRRNFFDKLIFSVNKNYNKIINSYKKNINERSLILKNFKYDEMWVDNIEKNISNLGLTIYELRQIEIKLLNSQIKRLNQYYKFPFDVKFEISDSEYSFEFGHEKYLQKLKLNRNYDSKFGGSRLGPHKSDFKIIINDSFEASQLSTGQQKTLVIMILLAQCDHMVHEKNIKPILLLDELCSHLDDTNRRLLLKLSTQFDLQVFLSGNERSLFSFISTNSNFCNIT
tara:strand:+ start:1194 stop:2276 length:1083 start_codon:yes stop_codon:yes gene_type:complete